jgi:putative ubiquitin-RnfH superfamily antitoxin RatB of RatAB toxin-antitoxin module
MKVEIIYARQESVFCEQLELPERTTIEDAIARSRVLAQYPEIDWGVNKIGIYGKLVSSATPLQDKDRVEIYRPLKTRKRSR